MSTLKNIIFDFDGVIADSGELIYRISEICDPNMTKESFIAHSCGNVLEEPRIDYQTKGMGYFFDMYSKELSLSHLRKSLYNIKLLSESFNLFIISSNVERGMKKVLKKASLLHLFGDILGYETHSSKIEKFKMLENQYGINNKNSVFITDTLGDIKEANKLGYKTIAETFGIHNRELLDEGNPYKIVDSWEEIMQEIQKL